MNCPKCGAPERRRTVICVIYDCESLDLLESYDGSFEQSDDCRIAELEAENARLRDELTEANYWRQRHSEDAEEYGLQTQEQFEEIKRLREQLAVAILFRVNNVEIVPIIKVGVTTWMLRTKFYPELASLEAAIAAAKESGR